MADFRPINVRITSAAIGACDHRDLLPRIDVPTLLLWGEDDERAGHVSNMEQPEHFNAEVRAFGRDLGG